MKRSSFLAAILLLSACGGVQREPPSLAPRPAESIDPRLPVEDRSGDGVVDPALAAQVNAIVDRGKSAAGQFESAIVVAERLAGSAGPVGSESWIAAQQALSAAIGARAPVTLAVGDLDALIERQVRGGISRADLAYATGSAEELSAIDQRQAARIDAVQGRLAS